MGQERREHVRQIIGGNAEITSLHSTRGEASPPTERLRVVNCSLGGALLELPWAPKGLFKKSAPPLTARDSVTCVLRIPPAYKDLEVLAEVVRVQQAGPGELRVALRFFYDVGRRSAYDRPLDELARLLGKQSQLEASEARAAGTARSGAPSQRAPRPGVSTSQRLSQADVREAAVPARRPEARSARLERPDGKSARSPAAADNSARLPRVEGKSSRLERIEGKSSRLERIEGKSSRLERIEGKSARLERTEGKSARLPRIEDKSSRLERVEGKSARLERTEGKSARLPRTEGKSARLPRIEDKAARLERQEQASRSEPRPVRAEPRSHLLPVDESSAARRPLPPARPGPGEISDQELAAWALGRLQGEAPVHLDLGSPGGTALARGSARLKAGEVRIALPPEFAAAIDASTLTAHVTATGAGPALYVAHKTAERLVVRASEGAGETGFDFLVCARRRD